MKKVCILGATGSIGTQTLQIIDASGEYTVVAVAAAKNIDKLEDQIRKFRPKMAAVYDEERAILLRDNIKDTETKVYGGQDGVRTVAQKSGADITVTAMVGNVGILPTLDAIEAGSDIALANKETMVCAGSIVKNVAAKKHVHIIPVDSEHSAVFQCIGTQKKFVKRIFLTASGGPFFGKTKQELKNVTLDDALKHPNWRMGKKITVDCATMMNKGLEVLEAVQLFDLRPEDIEVVIHRQSIVHSMVEFADHSILAQMGWPDMRIPIGVALAYPERFPTPTRALSFGDGLQLSFEKPDTDTFGCLALGYQAAKIGGTMPTVFCSAGEEAVGLFLAEKCSFLDIENIVRQTMEAHNAVIKPTLSCIIETDKWARSYVQALQEGMGK